MVKLAARRGWRDGEIGLPPVKGRRAGGSSGEGHGYAMGRIEGIILARGCRQRVCLDFLEKECRAVDVAVVGDGGDGGWGPALFCLGPGT